MSDVFAPQPVKTKTAGDVVVKLVDTAGTNVASVSASNALKVDGSAVTQPVSISGNQAVNVAQINGVTTLMGNGVTGTGSQRVTIASDNTAFAVNATLQTGSNTIGALTANQSVNNAQVAGTAVSVGSGVSGTGTQRVILASDQTSVPVTTGISGTVVDDYSTSSALAAGGTVTLDSTQIASGTGSLVEATVSASVALKAQLGTWDGTTFTVKRTFFVQANAPLIYIPQRYDEIQKATGATAKFRWSITNMDNANAADVYCSTTYWR